MDRKEIIRALVSFVGGIIISVAGLSVIDINQVSATMNSTPTRASVAQRANLATRTLTLTPELTNSPEPSATSASSETIVPFSDPPATPTIEPSPTIVLTLAPSFTPTAMPTLVPTNVPTVRRLPTQIPRSPSGPTATPTTDPRRGDSPFSAITISGADEWLTINASTKLWYKLGEKTSYPLHLQIWLDAYGRPGIGFSVFSPEQANNLNILNVDTKPKGRGTPTKATGHDYLWEGGSANAGTWYVLVSNDNSTPVQYKLNSSFTVTDHKNCYSYWEPPDPDRRAMGETNPWWWTACK